MNVFEPLGCVKLRDREQHPVALEHLALVGEVDRRHLELLGLDVAPDVELGPVGDRERAHALAAPHDRVEQVPDLRPLVARLPLAELVAEATARAPWPARAPRRAARRRTPRRTCPRRSASSSVTVCSRLRDGPSSCARPASIESCTRATISCSPSSATRRSRNSSTSGEVVAGVDVQDRARELRGPERLLGQPQEHDRVLAAAEQQHRPLELRRDLAHDVDGLVLQRVQLRASATKRSSPRSTPREPDCRFSGAAGAGTPARISIVGAGSRAKSS